ncbi:uncharacterized protein FTJAE_7474 [Fusarium tjaetaba]|uniref:Uncharacterized protein n=1 Tax=Fusarium tjaetaba TaxID=1567544 RepID=A0A8H5VS42_9HYPO|nr:uncharacterized protein FTJAE_7474 [Fusarium tjaetaba]KAF5632495.1 hypothetical protein FTJAE_7474 [Fusarium tjaetaba]
MSFEKALDVVVRRQSSRQLDPDIADRVIDEMMSSAILSVSCEDQILTAPVALSCIGACLVASSSEKAETSKVPISWGYCPTARESQAYMSDIKEYVDECYSTSKEIDDDFAVWLRFAQELNTAWAEQNSTVADRSVASNLKKATEECCLTQTEEAVKVAKKIAGDLGKTLDAATVTYTKASDNLPTGWEILRQQVVSGLSEGLTTALNQAIPTLVDNLDPIAKAKAAAGGGQSKQPPAVEARDPAYAQLARDLYLFDALYRILNSPSGVDWKSTEVTKEQPKSVISFILTMLDDSLTSFSKLESNRAPNRTENLYESKKASSGFSYQKPDKDDPMVKKWQEVFETLYSDIYALNTKARQLPGNPANPADQTVQISAKMQQAQLLVDTATKQLTTASETLKVTTEAYKEASKQLLEQHTVLANIKAEFTKLTKENMALDDIKVILVQCIKLIINIKLQITNLVRFLSAIATIIDVFVSKTITNFLKTVSIAVSSDPVALENGKVGNYSLLDAEQTMVYQGALTISAYFSLFADVGTMWRDVSSGHIFPGISLVERISASTNEPGEMERNVKILDDWSDNALLRIREICKAKEEEILKGMYERIEDVASTIKQLPAGTVPGQIQSVVEKTAKEVEEVTMKEIEVAAEYKPINCPSLVSPRAKKL